LADHVQPTRGEKPKIDRYMNLYIWMCVLIWFERRFGGAMGDESLSLAPERCQEACGSVGTTRVGPEAVCYRVLRDGRYFFIAF
jgi:hypothetical protein